MLSWIWPSSLARGRGVGHQEVGVPHWNWVRRCWRHTGKFLCRAGQPHSVFGDGVFEGVAWLCQWAIGTCRVSRMSLDTQYFSTWESCSGSTWGFGMFLWAPGIPCDPQPLHPYQQHPQLCHIHGANQHHIPLMSYWVPQSPSLGKRPSCESFHFPNQMRHKKQ